MLRDILKDYKHIDFSWNPNKTLFPITKIEFINMEEWNIIYRACKEELPEVEPTPSGSLPYNNLCKYNSRFMVISSIKSFELTICSSECGCYRFILGNKTPDNNTIKGSKALKVILEKAEEYNVLDTFKNNRGNYKENIQSPIIDVANDDYIGKEFNNVHHLDLNSSYASRIVEKFPELKTLYTDLYNQRKENNDYYKHVLTNSIGCMQSTACYDLDYSLFKRKPYDLSYFSMIAINGTNDKIQELTLKLLLTGRKPLLFNTDGIWYEGPIYHDNDEGDKLGQWKNDHINCKLYIKSPGAYQYIEDNQVKTVLRGSCQLDKIKPRDDWGWREIDSQECKIIKYKLDKEKGVIKYEDKN